MRPVLTSDLDACARALMNIDAATREAAIRFIIQEADLADRYRTRTGRAVRSTGNGTLEAAARGYGLAPRPNGATPDYCACLHLTLSALDQWRNRPRAGATLAS